MVKILYPFKTYQTSLILVSFDTGLPCPIIPVNGPNQGTFDYYILVCEDLKWDIPAWDFLKTPILEAAKVDKAVGVETLVFSCAQDLPVVYAPTGPVNRDYDDVRRYYDAAVNGIKRALKGGSRCPLLVTISKDTFPNAWSVSLLGALHALYVGCNVNYIKAIESGRYVCQDIGGSDPERMAAPRVEEYIRELFQGSPVKVTVVKDPAEFEKNYPLYAAVNRCARVVERHTGRIINLEYVGEGDIQNTVLLVGKGVTYDTGGADIKAGGFMAGMSSHFRECIENSMENMHTDGVTYDTGGADIKAGGFMAGMSRDKCGAAAVAGFFQALEEKVPTHIVTIATLTGHAIIAVGLAYSIVIDNGPAARTKFAQNIQKEYAEVLQCNNSPSSRTPRGHQFPAAFLIRASGLDKHGIDSERPLCYSHFDIAGSSGSFPQVPTGAPVVAMTEIFLKSHC
ncbi:putative aminopeptidase W07G4.4 [Stylophora pistillata]|uniref:Putative aminopeptidase W07G4.4 n=1 Tax=Stylophora pistillata TaxID=50429 RepID=A0A2B4RFL7_STYPI|nr:putative aminopeptidase W07G4.4 [Stylophora pistillata]